jgi:WD40 repeat protein
MPLQLEAILSGHTDVVWCAAWSPSGRALATAGGDKQVRVWTIEPDPEKGPDATKFVCKQVLDGVSRHPRTR